MSSHALVVGLNPAGNRVGGEFGLMADVGTGISFAGWVVAVRGSRIMLFHEATARQGPCRGFGPGEWLVPITVYSVRPETPLVLIQRATFG